MTQRELMECDEELDLPTLLEQAGDAPVGHAWPKMLADFVDVLQAAALDEGVKPDQAPTLARKMAAALAHYLGGRQIYLSSGEPLRQALRWTAIWQEWDGRPQTKHRLAKKYGLSVRRIEQIVVEQSALHRNRFQGKLFPQADPDA